MSAADRIEALEAEVRRLNYELEDARRNEKRADDRLQQWKDAMAGEALADEQIIEGLTSRFGYDQVEARCLLDATRVLGAATVHRLLCEVTP